MAASHYDGPSPPPEEIFEEVDPLVRDGGQIAQGLQGVLAVVDRFPRPDPLEPSGDGPHEEGDPQFGRNAPQDLLDALLFVGLDGDDRIAGEDGRSFNGPLRQVRRRPASAEDDGEETHLEFGESHDGIPEKNTEGGCAKPNQKGLRVLFLSGSLLALLKYRSDARPWMCPHPTRTPS